MVDSRRELHLLVRDSAGGRILVQPGSPPALPSLTISLEQGQTTVQGALGAIRRELGIGSPLLEVHFDHAADPDAGPIPALTVLEPATHLPDGLAWHDVGAEPPPIAAGLRPRLDQLLAEVSVGATPPAERPAWARPGWYDRASRWIAETLTSRGRAPTGPPEQVRHWGISAVMRVPTGQGAAWFKATFPLFRHELAVTRLLDREVPGSVPRVLGVEPDAGWLLLDDFGTAFAIDSPEGRDDDAAIRALVELQRRLIGRVGELRAIGCPERPLTSLEADLGAALDTEVARADLGVDPPAGRSLVEWTRRAVGEVSELGFPDTLAHGDFHPGNVAIVGGRPVIFDWSDSPIGHPLLDAVTWLDWFEEGDARAERAWRTFVDAWSDVCPPPRLAALRPALLGVASAFITVSYVRILEAMEPLSRPQLADAGRRFADRLRAAAAQETANR